MKCPIKIDSQLLSSLKVLSSILKDDGSILERHILLKNNWCTATNGILSIGEPIVEDLIVAPNGLLMREALAKCGASFSITQLPHTLEIKGGRFKAVIPCMPPEDLQGTFPDPPVASLDDRLCTSLKAVAPLALDENSVVTASVLIHNGTVTATDRKVIIQAFHGNDMPTLVIPKIFVKLVIKNKIPFKSFGFSNSSFTIYLENGGWLKTQLCADKWPDIDTILNHPSNRHPLPENFWEAIDAVEAFTENGWMYTKNCKICSHEDQIAGATLECKVPDDIVFSSNQIKLTKNWAKTIDFTAINPNGMKCIKIYGDTIRCAIAGRI